jgi:O-antigen ligase
MVDAQRILSSNFFKYHSAVDGENFDYNPKYNQPPYQHSDYTYFYLGIGICTFLALILIFFNIFFGCCSPWRKYWMSRFTGNRFVLPIYILPPKDQEPLHL